MNTQMACRSAWAPGVRRVAGCTCRPCWRARRSAKCRQRPLRRQRGSVQRLGSGHACRSSSSARRKYLASASAGVSAAQVRDRAAVGGPSSASRIVRNSATASSTVSFCKGHLSPPLALGDDAARAIAHAPSAPRETPAKVRRDAGAYSTTAGPCGPRRPARASSRTFWVLWTSRSGGCLSAPAFGDLCPGPHFGFPLRPIAGASRSHLEPLKAGSGSPPLLALHRYRSARASWISSPPFGSPSRRRSPPREGRIDPRPVAGQRRTEYRHGPEWRG